ncbi:MAG: DUF4007 family protein [Eubacterium sp.]|nr:DUF4007 family protein [Eubacterium sp.]
MPMRFRAHDTFFIRKGWLSKGMKAVNNAPDVFVSKEKNPMDELGIGSNMVKALRYWLQVVGLTEEPKSGKRDQSFTELGEAVFKYDRYIEEIGTLYLLHYKMVTDKDNATTWYYFYNVFGLKEFVRDDFVRMLQSYITIEEEAKPDRTLNDDFTCLMNTYVPRYKSNPKKVSAENNIDCPFGELGLIDIIGKKGNEFVYKKTTPNVKSFNPWIVLAIIIDQASDKKEIPLSELLTSPGNIGKVFNLDSISMMDLLHSVEKTGKIKIIRTAGLDIIQLIDTEELSFMDCVKRFYDEIEG